MKKTLNINIGNSIIHLEEDAYELLKGYLNEVKQHFSKNADDFEIVTDIENRIAELFAEMLEAQQKQVIGVEDVQAMMLQMGSVSDFENSEADESTVEDYVAAAGYDQVKKLYRDTDQAMIAGVCAGFGHYLDLDIRWVRVLALLSFLLGGSGVVAYLVMWIVIPKAESRAEKMAMYGETPNLKGFANSHLNPLFKQSRGFIAELMVFLGNIFQKSSRFVFKAIAAAIVIFGSMLLLFVVGCLAAFMGFWDASIYSYFPLSIVNEDYMVSLTIAVFLSFAIPLLALILFSIRVVFNTRAVHKMLSFGLLVVWLGALVVGIFFIAKISSEFKESAEFTQVVPVTEKIEYYLTVDRSRFFTKADSLQYSIDPANYKGRKILNEMNGPFSQPRNVKLRIEKSEKMQSSLSQNYFAKGKTFEQALKAAQRTHYDFVQKDSLLIFSPTLQILDKGNWRDQEVELVLKVPVGLNVFISKDFDRYIRGDNFWDCESDENKQYTQWVMTEEGLKCVKEDHDHEPE